MTFAGRITAHKTPRVLGHGGVFFSYCDVLMLTKKERAYAIFKSLYFGILPSWFYEKCCHYAANGEGMNIKNYKEHLILNLTIVKCLILKTEHECTHEFHKMKIKKWLRWQYK